jgi:hypothetical protein
MGPRQTANRSLPVVPQWCGVGRSFCRALLRRGTWFGPHEEPAALAAQNDGELEHSPKPSPIGLHFLESIPQILPFPRVFTGMSLLDQSLVFSGEVAGELLGIALEQAKREAEIRHHLRAALGSGDVPEVIRLAGLLVGGEGEVTVGIQGL